MSQRRQHGPLFYSRSQTSCARVVTLDEASVFLDEGLVSLAWFAVVGGLHRGGEKSEGEGGGGCEVHLALVGSEGQKKREWDCVSVQFQSCASACE